MATLRLPVLSGTDEAHRFEVELDGSVYDLSLRWNTRESFWYLDVLRNGVAVLVGVKVVHASDVLAQFGHLGVTGDLPPGVFKVLDVNGADADPSSSTLGDSVLLLYNEAP